MQQLYQTMQPGRTTFRISLVKRINNASDAMEFLLSLEQYDRWSNKRIVLDCNAKNAKNILVEHVRKVQLGRRTYHYMLSGLVSFFCFTEPTPNNVERVTTNCRRSQLSIVLKSQYVKKVNSLLAVLETYTSLLWKSYSILKLNEQIHNKPIELNPSRICVVFLKK